jgi:hypothetical protein
MYFRPRISIASRISAKGEGVFQSLLSGYATLHKVNTPDDIGIDYFCEWINQVTDESFESSNILFAVQLKTSEKENVVATSKGIDNRLNLLEKFDLKRSNGNNYDDIKPRTIEYWKGFEIPVYLFVVLTSHLGNELYFKRFTPILHGTVKRGDEMFYKASLGTNFLAFASPEKIGGFCRDLFIDYIRCNYKKGSIAYRNPRGMGLNQFSENPKTIFIDMVSKEYNEQIKYTYNKLNELGFFNSNSDEQTTLLPE